MALMVMAFDDKETACGCVVVTACTDDVHDDRGDLGDDDVHDDRGDLGDDGVHDDHDDRWW